jgi:integrase
MALTKRDVDRLEYDPSGPAMQISYDGEEIPGFGVRVFASGAKSFVVWYRTASGRKRLHTLGKYGTLTLQQGRELARRTLMQAKTGSDPMEARQKARRGETVRELAEMYLERHAKQHKKTWREDERRINKWVIPALGSRKVEDVRRADVARLHGRIGERAPYEANRVLALVAVMFTKAAEWGIVEETTPNPAARVQTFKEKSRDRWVTPGELPALVEAITAEPSPYIRAAVKLYLLTGLRRSELLGLRWKDIAFDRRELRLEDTKAGRSHNVPLSAAAVEVLREVPRQLGNAYVFPGKVPGQPLVNIAKSWRRVRRRAGMEDVRLHDLRRTVGSWLATSGASLPLIGKVLNHSNASTTQVYARLSEDDTRTALELHGETIGPLLNGVGGVA